MLSVCIITKNEKEKLNRCLESLAPYPLEAVVVDTGSSDGTIEMIDGWRGREDAAFCVVTGTFAWRDDFSAAKNYAVSLASSDTVLVLDSDEEIEEMDLPGLESVMQKYPNRLGRILRKNMIEQNGQINFQQEYISRAFVRGRYLYQGRIHEQLVPCEETARKEICAAPDEGEDRDVYPSYPAPVVIRHDGYLGTAEQKRKKAMRNEKLLLCELEQNGEDPYLLYQLGKSCYMQGEYRKAADYFARGLAFDLNPKLEYVIDMVETYGYALINSGQADTALQFENIYREFGDSADFKLLMGLIYMNNEMFEEAVAEFQGAAKCRTARMHGANSFLAHYNTGVIFECLGAREKAAHFYRKCKDYAPAAARLSAMNM